MKLEYLDDIREIGNETPEVYDQLIRLYDFDQIQASKFQQAISRIIISEKETLDIGSLSFITGLNCKLTFRLSDKNLGISTLDKIDFYCDLTLSGFENMVHLIKPFCTDKTNGFQWLYDLENGIELLFSPGGQW